jgi:hypothetical protein
MSAAAALAKLMSGVVFDEAADKLLSADDGIAVARKDLQEPAQCCPGLTSITIMCSG